MKIIIDIKESESLGLGYLAGIDGRNRKNFIEQVLKKHLHENMDMIPKATRRDMNNADMEERDQAKAERSA
jgi:hypothetical protein